MGLNLNINHVSFSSLEKFDGRYNRNLAPNELVKSQEGQEDINRMALLVILKKRKFRSNDNTANRNAQF